MEGKILRVFAVFVFSLSAALEIRAQDGSSVQAYCEATKQAAKDAQKKYVALHTPTVSPQDVFNRSVKTCSEYIAKSAGGFKLSIPSLGDIQGMLEREAEKLVGQACRGAQDQFNKAVDEATQIINAAALPVTQVPGVNVDVDPRRKLGIGLDVDATGSAASGRASDSLFNKIR